MPSAISNSIISANTACCHWLRQCWQEGERLSTLQWSSLVLGGKLDPASLQFEGFGWSALACIGAALMGISCGTLYQKRYCTGMPLLGGTVVQYLGALTLTGLGSLALEQRQIEWNSTFVLTLVWLVLVLSIAAILLLMALIKRGTALSGCQSVLPGPSRRCAGGLVAV